jgi:PAS domain S-box-containing protein
VVLATPLRRGKEAPRVLIVDIDIDRLNRRFLDPVKVGIRGHAWMMDGDGTLLYHPTQPRMIGKNLYRADRTCFECHTSFDVEKKILESGDVGFSSYIAPYGEDKLISFSRVRVSSLSWIVCVSIPYSEVTYSIRESMRLHSLLVISIFVATLSGAFAVVVMNRKRVKAEEKTKHLEARRQLEKEIVESKDYLENLLQSTESKILVIGSDLKVKTVNNAYQRMCGKTKEETIGRSFRDVCPLDGGENREMIQDAVERCLAGNGQRLSNFGYSHAGRRLFLNVSMSPLVLHGAVEGVILSTSDVTEEVSLKRKIQDYALRLEEMVVSRTDELREEKEKLDAIVRAIEGGLCVMEDSTKRCVWANKIFLDLLGACDINEMDATALYANEAFRDPIDHAIQSGQIYQTVVYAPFGGKTGYFQTTVNPFIDRGGQTEILVLIQDITEMKKMEERLMHSEKLSALARISAGVAHEIGNPLTSISSYVQILREMDHDEFTKESLDTIAKHINRIADIVRQMSSFSKTKPSDLRHYEVRDLVDMTLDLVKYDKRMKHMTVHRSIPETLPQVVVDETQLIQVLMNIILNAADAMTNGGSLDISASLREKEVEISLADTGPGISPENMERIFDPFFTTKEKGTGLGLAVSYNIIKSYQGDILVENRPEGGTIFKVRLPYYES